MDKNKIIKEIESIDREIKNLSKQTYTSRKIQERIAYLVYKRNVYKMYLDIIDNNIKTKGGKRYEYK